MNTKQLITLILFLLSLVATGIYFYTLPVPSVATTETITLPKNNNTLSTTNEVATPTTTDELATPTTTTQNHFHWQIGTKQTYRYQSNVNLKIDTSATLNQKAPTWQKINNKLSGILNMRIFDTKKDRVRMGFQLSTVDFTINDQAIEEFTALLQTFFLVEMSLEGKPLNFHFPRYINPANQKFIKEIINNVQIILTKDVEKKSWQTQEMSNMGFYQAHYQHQNNANIHKQKIDYLSINLQGQDNTELFNLRGEIKQTTFTAQLAKQKSWLASLKGQEHIELYTQNGKLADIRTTIQLTASNDVQDPNLGIWLAVNNYDHILTMFADATDNVSLSKDVLEQLKQKGLRQQYANTDLSTLVSQMYEKFSKAKSIKTQEIVRYSNELEEYLTAYPDAALQMPELLDELNPSGKLSSYLIGALENAGTPQAQQALSTIAINFEPEAKERAIQATMSFNFIKVTEAGAVETLWKLADNEDSERSSTAILALGSVVSNTPIPQQKEAISSEITQRLHQRGEDTATLLGAIGNSRDSSLLPDVEPYLNDADPYVRIEAVEALRHFDDSVSLQYIIDISTGDEYQTVRKSALYALRQRQEHEKIQAVNPLSQYLPHESDAPLRATIIQFLGEHKSDNPVAIEALQQQLKQEKTRLMRKEVYNAIYR